MVFVCLSLASIAHLASVFDESSKSATAGWLFVGGVWSLGLGPFVAIGQLKARAKVARNREEMADRKTR